MKLKNQKIYWIIAKKLGMKDPVSFFILHGLKYLGNNFFINKNHKERLDKNTRSYKYVYAKYVGMG